MRYLSFESSGRINSISYQNYWIQIIFVFKIIVRLGSNHLKFILVFVFSICSLVAATAFASDGTREAQKLLNKLGYNVGTVDGIYGKKTERALEEFYSTRSDFYDGTLDGNELKALQKAVEVADNNSTMPKESKTNTFTNSLPANYFAGFGTQWYVNIHNWRDGGLGKKRYFEPLETDLNRYKKAGAPVMRFQVNMDGAIFWKECNWQADGNYDVRNTCYHINYKLASDNSWKKQINFLREKQNNPVIDEYVKGALRLQEAGFHVIIVPQDFFWGNGGNWITSSDIPLLHAYLERDKNFQTFYIEFSQYLVSKLIKSGVKNFSFQTLNEPRFCENGRPQVNQWQRLERRIIDSVRTLSPELYIISSAVCTAADQPLSKEKRYTSLNTYLPNHKKLRNISYAIHMRNPRLIHIAENQQLESGTKLHYPFKKIDEAVAESKNSLKKIKLYNKIKPNLQHYRKIFSDIAKTAQSRKVRIIITEWSISKPDYGLPKSHRVNLVRDVLSASKEYNIPIIYNGLLGRDGLSSTTDNERRPSHDFDEKILKEFSVVNF